MIDLPIFDQPFKELCGLPLWSPLCIPVLPGITFQYLSNRALCLAVQNFPTSFGNQHPYLGVAKLRHFFEMQIKICIIFRLPNEWAFLNAFSISESGCKVKACFNSWFAKPEKNFDLKKSIQHA